MRSKEYKTEIYNNTPSEYQQSIQYLYNRLEQLDKIINENNKNLNIQSTRATDEIIKRAADAERKINEYWESSKRKADFYYYIGLHYASFTLADKLTKELQSLRKIEGILTNTINDTQSRIDALKNKINNAKSVADIVQAKRNHQELCKKCDAFRKTRKMCKGRIIDIQKHRDKQNNITRKRRDYIGTHFRNKGKQWRKRIMSKHIQLYSQRNLI